MQKISDPAMIATSYEHQPKTACIYSQKTNNLDFSL